MICELLMYGFISGEPETLDVFAPKQEVYYRLEGHGKYIANDCQKWTERPRKGQFYYYKGTHHEEHQETPGTGRTGIR